MGQIPFETFISFFIFLFVPFIFGFLAKKINISPLVGYIIGGVILGNFFQGIISSDIINGFAYIGIALLLFTVGININLQKVFVLKRFILLGGLLQLLLTTFFVAIVSSFFGFTPLQSFLIAIAFVSSSTAIVSKIIQDRGEEDSFLGEVTVGILMFQDLAFIPLILIFTLFNSQNVSFLELTKNVFISLAIAALILYLTFFIGKRVIPILFDIVAKVSRELLNLLVFIFMFFIVGVFSLLNLHIFVGAFIAGVLIAQSLEHFHIFSQIRPLRDITAIVFLVFIGTNIQVSEIISIIPQVLFFTLLIITAKVIIFLSLFLYFKFSSRMAFTIAIFLFQISENAFILILLAYFNGVFSSQQFTFLITAVILSLLITPWIINNKYNIYYFIRLFFKKYIPAIEVFIKHKLDFDKSPLEEFAIADHVVICGYGRIGSTVGRSLNLANIPFIGIDYNINTVEKAKKEGVNVVYGDPTDMDTLKFVKTGKALAVVVSVPGKTNQEAVILNSKKLSPSIYIISRVHNSTDQERALDLGAKYVVRSEIEASLSIVKKLFLLKKMPKDEVVKRLRNIRLMKNP
ncbi:MAG: cation:proton antiporter [Patescibacteria group bacterium]